MCADVAAESRLKRQKREAEQKFSDRGQMAIYELQLEILSNNAEASAD